MTAMPHLLFVGGGNRKLKQNPLFYIATYYISSPKHKQMNVYSGNNTSYCCWNFNTTLVLLSLIFIYVPVYAYGHVCVDAYRAQKKVSDPLALVLSCLT